MEELWRFSERWRAVKEKGWLVMKTDLYRKKRNDALIVDFKTGKIYDSNIEQMEVYAAGAFAKWPGLQHLTVELHYLDQREIKESEYTRKQGLEFREKWTDLGRQLLAADEFPARPSRLCQWCPYAGDPCRDGVQTGD